MLLKNIYLLGRLLSYRAKMNIKYIKLYKNGDGYPLCPRCFSAIDRDYILFCTRCGQRLGWSKLGKAEYVLWKENPRCNYQCSQRGLRGILYRIFNR